MFIKILKMGLLTNVYFIGLCQKSYINFSIQYEYKYFRKVLIINFIDITLFAFFILIYEFF